MPLDRNPNSIPRLMRNFQRIRDGGVVASILVTPPLFNSGVALSLSLDANGGLESSSSLLRVKTRDTSFTRDASGVGVALRTNGGLSISSGLGMLLPANSGLQTLVGGTSILLNPTNPALSLTSGLEVTVSGTSLTKDATGVLVSLRTTPGLQIATGLGVLLDATDPALSLTSGLTVLVAAGQGLTKTASGVETVLADTSLAKAVAGLSVNLRTDGGLSTASGLGLGVLTTKGDLLGFTTVHARQAVGTARQILVADPTPATGLAWYTPQDTRNLLINGGLRVWQRGTSFAAPPNSYSADRWSYRGINAGVVTLSQSADVPTVAGANFSHVVTVTTIDAAPTFAGVQYRFEGQDFAVLFGRPLVLSFWVKSNLTGTFGVSLRNAGFSRTFIASYTITTAATWQRVIVTLTHDTTGTWVTTGTGLGASLMFAFAASVAQQGVEGWQAGDFKSGSGQVNLYATAANTFQLALIQLEIGTVASEFEHTRLTDEHMRCKRYFQKSFSIAVAPAQATGNTSPVIYTTTLAGTAVPTGVTIAFVPEMRTLPTMTFFNVDTATTLWRNSTLAADSGAPAVLGLQATGAFFQNPQVAGDATGNIMQVHWSGDAEL